MRQRLFIFALCAGLAVSAACGFDRKADTSAKGPVATDSGSVSTKSSDSGSSSDTGSSTDTGSSSDTGSTDTGSSSDTSFTDTGSSTDTGFSDTGSFSDSGPSTSGSSGTVTTGSTTGGLNGYSEAFKASFVKGCVGTAPGKQGACQCVIDKISASIPLSEFLSIAGTGDTQKIMSDPRLVQIITDCKLGG